MSFGTTKPRSDYTGTGGTATYAFGFRIFDYTDLLVMVQTTAGIITTLVYNVDFTVSAGALNNPNGGTITLTAGNLANGSKLTIRFYRTTQQTTKLRNQGGFFLNVHEDKFDEIVRMIQQNEDQLNRSVSLPGTEVGTPGGIALPAASLRALQFLGFDISGNPVVGSPTNAVVSVTMQPVVSALSLLAALQVLLINKHGADMVAAATLALDNATGDIVDVTGNTGITAITLAEGVEKTVRFTGTPTITNGASLVLPSGANITAAAGDYAVFRGYAAGVVRCVGYLTASGLPLVSADGPGVLINGQIQCTVATNALTFALKTKAGNDPSASDAVKIAFRKAAVTDGGYVVRTITSALSITVANTATLGTANGVTARIYCGFIDNAGTVEMTVHNPLTTSGLVAFPESGLVSTTGPPGNAAGVLYSTTARASVAFRLGAYAELNEATAGTWATGPSVVQTMGPGVKRTGDTVQTAFTSTGAVATGIGAKAADDNIMTTSDGDQYMTLAITPTSTINRLRHFHQGQWTNTTATEQCLGLFQDSTVNALCQAGYGRVNGSQLQQLTIMWEMAAGLVVSTTFKLREGSATGATTTFNGIAGVRRGGGALDSVMMIEEIFT